MFIDKENFIFIADIFKFLTFYYVYTWQLWLSFGRDYYDSK